MSTPHRSLEWKQWHDALYAESCCYVYTITHINSNAGCAVHQTYRGRFMNAVPGGCTLDGAKAIAEDLDRCCHDEDET